MAASGCSSAMELLNQLFETALILNDGHEIFARLAAGDDPADLVEEYARKFGRPAAVEDIRQVTDNWPPLHIEATGRIVEWALSKLDTDDRITVHWKGDAASPETFTRFELRGNDLTVEFAHPPTAV